MEEMGTRSGNLWGLLVEESHDFYLQNCKFISALVWWRL